MKVIFTDLDGTLLDEETYSFEPAMPALRHLRDHGVPLVLCTSKTRAEVEDLRTRLGNRDPFIVENGGAVLVPETYFRAAPHGSRKLDGYFSIELGTPYPELVESLQRASALSGCQVRGFHQMTVDEVAGRTGLSRVQAALAKEREYDEPFEVLNPGCTGKLLAEIEKCGKRWTRGGNFFHITGDNDKRRAVEMLLDLYRQDYGEIESVGLGDSLNDAGLLQVVDWPVVVRSRFAVQLKKAVPRAVVTEAAGPEGWAQEISAIFSLQGAA